MKDISSVFTKLQVLKIYAAFKSMYVAKTSDSPNMTITEYEYTARFGAFHKILIAKSQVCAC